MSKYTSDADKDPNELEREIEEERAHINETLRALEKRFSPGQMLDQVLSYTRSNGGDFSRNLVDTVKTNPVPALLTATGLMWMIYGQNRSAGDGYMRDLDIKSRASYGVDPEYQSASGGDAYGNNSDAIKEKASKLRSSASSSAQNVKQRLSQMTGSAHRASDNTRRQAQRASQGFEHMLREQPLALGAIGIALGALAGASLPRTQKENETLGRTRDQIAESAKQGVEQTLRESGDTERSAAQQSQREGSFPPPPTAHH